MKLINFGVFDPHYVLDLALLSFVQSLLLFQSKLIALPLGLHQDQFFLQGLILLMKSLKLLPDQLHVVPALDLFLQLLHVLPQLSVFFCQLLIQSNQLINLVVILVINLSDNLLDGPLQVFLSSLALLMLAKDRVLKITFLLPLLAQPP